jgi:hypothetical protein
MVETKAAQITSEPKRQHGKTPGNTRRFFLRIGLTFYAPFLKMQSPADEQGIDHRASRPVGQSASRPVGDRFFEAI